MTTNEVPPLMTREESVPLPEKESGLQLVRRGGAGAGGAGGAAGRGEW